MSHEAPSRGPIALVLEDPRVPWILAAFYVLVGVVLVETDYTLNDEGLFTYMSAAQTRQAFEAFLFFQKSKPVLSVFYFLPMLGGLTSFLVAHVVVAATAIPLASAIGRALKFSAPNFPAFVIAFSPLHFFGGAAGLANTDGVAGVLLFLYLLLARRQFLLAGMVLGPLPWVRHELAMFCVLAALFPLVSERTPRVLLGSLVFPLLYWLGGWHYHHDPLWILHYPPTTLEPPGQTAHNPLMPLFYRTASLSNALPYILAVSPMVPLMFLAGWRGVTFAEWILVGYSAAWLGLSIVLPSFQYANFGFVPRYMLPILPAAALLSGRVVSRWRSGERPGVPWVIVTLCLLTAMWLQHDLPTFVLQPVLVLGVIAALVFWGLSSAAIAAVLFMTVVGPGLGFPTQVPRKDLAGYLPATERWLREHQQEIRGPIFTNSLLLAPYLQRRAPDLHLEVRFMLAADQLADALAMANQSVGQLEEGKRAFITAGVPGGGAVWTAALNPGNVPPNTLFAFRPGDGRIRMTLPPEIWEPHLSLINEEGCRIYRFVP